MTTTTNELNRTEIERTESNNLLARVLECFDGFRVECWIVNTGGRENGQYIRTKAYKTLSGARKYAARFVAQ